MTASQLISGERFFATYHIAGDHAQATATAHDICLEQTVEFPDELIPDGMIRDHIVGRIESLTEVSAERFCVRISYAIETVGNELTQFLNVIFGNISIKQGIRLVDIELPKSLCTMVKGPRFGCDGLRRLLNVKDRPLLCTALKPMGSTAEELAVRAGQFALGGIDIIKEDHGLANQPFAPFEKRIELCAAAVAAANKKTGRNCIYVPSISAPSNDIVRRVAFAKNAGAAGILIAPGLVGFDTMRMIAEDDTIALPVIAHPSFFGTYAIGCEVGISHSILYGLLPRLAGADATIYPNYGGRFSFSPQECTDIVKASATPLHHIRPIFPTPAGGMTLARVPDLKSFYGNEVIFLIGGGS